MSIENDYSSSDEIKEQLYISFIIEGIDMSEFPPLEGYPYFILINKKTGLVEFGCMIYILEENNQRLQFETRSLGQREEGWYIRPNEWVFEYRNQDHTYPMWRNFKVLLYDNDIVFNSSNELINMFEDYEHLENLLISDNIYTLMYTYLNDENWGPYIKIKPTTKRLTKKICRILEEAYDVPEDLIDIILNQTETSTHSDIDHLGLHLLEDESGELDIHFTFENINENKNDSDIESDYESDSEN
jgi:hypothetical protein